MQDNKYKKRKEELASLIEEYFPELAAYNKRLLKLIMMETILVSIREGYLEGFNTAMELGNRKIGVDFHSGYINRADFFSTLYLKDNGWIQ